MSSKRPAPVKKIALGQYWTSAEVADFMVELTGVPPTTPVLEAGFGHGAFLEAFARAGFDDVTGYDFDETNLDFCRPLFPDYKLSFVDYLATSQTPRFGAAIGNPPYVSWNNIGNSTKALLDTPFWSDLTNGEWDLLYAFLVWEIEQTLPGGKVCLIIPINFFASTLAASLRRYMATHGHFETIVSFGEFSPFADAAPNAIIFDYRKHDDQPCDCPPFRVLELTARRAEIGALLTAFRAELANSAVHPYERVEATWRSFTSAPLPADATWFLAAPSEMAAAVELERVTSHRLADVATVGVGMVSGYDAAYKLTPAERASLPKGDDILVRELVKAADCRRWNLSGTTPYLFADDVADEATLHTDHPAVETHLAAHRASLEARYLGRTKRWWDWATVRNRSLFEDHADAGKLFIPGIDRSLVSRWSYTEAKVMGAGDVLCVVPKDGYPDDILFLLGWLNSSLVDGWYRTKGNRTGHRTRYTQSHVERIPVLLIDHANQAEKLAYLKVIVWVQALVAGTAPDPARLETQIDQELRALVAAR